MLASWHGLASGSKVSHEAFSGQQRGPCKWRWLFPGWLSAPDVSGEHPWVSFFPGAPPFLIPRGTSPWDTAWGP